MSDSVYIDLGRHQIANFFVHRGEHEFRFFDFSGNCELRFCSNFYFDSMHQHGGCIKILHLGKFL